MQAVLIAPVEVTGSTVLPARSTISGKVKSARRVGFGIVYVSAAIELQFDHLVFPDRSELPIAARVTQVENVRERVNRKVLIERVRSTAL